VRKVTIGLSVLGPLALWATVYVAVMGFRDAEQAMADDNAGRVLNARVVDGDVVTAIDRMLEAREPRVVVIGPSYANTNVRPARLAEHLGLDPSDVALVSVPNSVGAHWYAILKYRVLEAGHRPALVLFVSGLQSMLLTTPLSESSFVNLRAQLPPAGDPLVDAKVRGSADLWWATVREQRGKVRGAFFDALRDGSVFWLDDARTRRALGRVFDDANIDMGLYGHAMPVIESSARADRGFTPDLLPPPEQSFMGDVTALAAAAGVKAVWVRPPMSPHIPIERDDVAPPGFQSRAIEVVSDRGGAYVDLRHLRMSSRMYRNEDHMNAEGSARFTRALARIVRERGWLVPAEPPPSWALRVDGDAELAAGERLVVTAAAPWPEGLGDFAVGLSAETLGEREHPPFTVHFGESELTPMRGRAIPHDGEIWQQWRLAAELPAPAGPSTLAIHALPRGPGLSVQALAFGQREPRRYAVGDEGALRGERLEVLGGDARGLPEGVVLETPRAVAAVPDARRELLAQPGAVAAFDTARLSFLSDESLQGASSWSQPCSPLRIAEDGVLLSRPNAPCTEVRSVGRGRSCHTRDTLFFSASDRSDPATNGRAYELRLAERRACGGELFVYPVDRLRLTVAPEQVARFVRGARFVTLTGRYLQRRKTRLVVRVFAGEQRVLERSIDGRRLERGSVSLRFESAAAYPDGTPWVVGIDNPDHTFYLLRGITLSERAISTR